MKYLRKINLSQSTKQALFTYDINSSINIYEEGFEVLSYTQIISMEFFLNRSFT